MHIQFQLCMMEPTKHGQSFGGPTLDRLRPFLNHPGLDTKGSCGPNGARWEF